MQRRHRLTRFLIGKIRAGKVPHLLPKQLSTEEQAFYLQGTYFNTAVVQMSEAMVYLCMAIAQHDEVQARLEARLDDLLRHFVAHQSKFAMLGRLGDLAEGRTVIAMEVHIRADDPLSRLRSDHNQSDKGLLHNPSEAVEVYRGEQRDYFMG